MPGVHQGSRQPIPQVSRQAQIVDVNGPAVIGNMSAQNLNLLKLNSKPASQCLKLYDIRGK